MSLPPVSHLTSTEVAALVASLNRINDRPLDVDALTAPARAAGTYYDPEERATIAPPRSHQ